VIFATPHFYWALGGRAGLGAQTAAADAALQQGWFAAYNLTAGCLGLLGAAMALVLANRWVGQRMHRWLMIASMAACAGLLLRGILGLTLLGVSLFRGTLDRETPALLLAIEPWFVLGGLAYAGMALSQRRGPTRAPCPTDRWARGTECLLAVVADLQCKGDVGSDSDWGHTW